MVEVMRKCMVFLHSGVTFTLSGAGGVGSHKPYFYAR
jgi:hypothetical protein